MLFSSVFTPSTEKMTFQSLISLKPEGPLGSYLCDVTLPAQLITYQFLFCGQRNSTRSFTCERNLDYFYFSRINFCILVFLLFSLSLLPLTMLLFKIFIVDFLHLLTGYFDMRFRDSRYIQHNARVQSVRKSCFLYQKF